MQSNKLIFILLLVLFCSCHNNSKSKTDIEKLGQDMASSVVENQSKEDFKSFLTKFQQDSAFQFKRIEFPLTDSIYESGSYMDDSGNVIDLYNRKVIINKEEWKYQSLTEYEKIISKISENEYKVELQIEDTGVSVNYIFKINDDKWYLVRIVDKST